MDFDTNKITLEYLANNIYNKSSHNTDNKIINYEEVLFYKKRLLKVFKLQLKNYKVNNDIDNIYNKYITNLIYSFKVEDRNEEIQKNLNNMNEDTTHKLNEDTTHKLNMIMCKKNKNKPNIEKFVINKKKEKMIYPEIKSINIGKDYYKKKYNKNVP